MAPRLMIFLAFNIFVLPEYIFVSSSISPMFFMFPVFTCISLLILILFSQCPDSMITLDQRSILVGHFVGPTLTNYVYPTQICSLGHRSANMLAQRCTNVGHVGHITLIQRWANIHCTRWPNVSWHTKSHRARSISLGILFFGICQECRLKCVFSTKYCTGSPVYVYGY